MEAKLEVSPSSSPHVPAWVPVVDHVIDRFGTSVLPAIATRIKRSGPDGHIAVLWCAFGALTLGFVLHVLGDGTLRAKVDRTECHVNYLVERAIAEDRGEPPPPFSPLACYR